MHDFVNRLPWRLAAVAGLLIGVVSGISGTDLWECLARVGFTFLVFGLAGVGLRAVLLQSKALKPPLPTEENKPPAQSDSKKP